MTLNGWLRYDVVCKLLADVEGEQMLEIGTGVGALGARVAERFQYVGVEPDAQSAARAQARLAGNPRAQLIVGTTADLPPDLRFDLVAVFEVIEHIEDDLAALQDWASRLREGGSLLLSTPAGSRRFAAADVRAGHFRRYDREELAGLLHRAGFVEIEIVCYGFPLGNALRRTWNVLARAGRLEGSKSERTSASGRWLQPTESLGWMTEAVSWPFRLLQRPFFGTDLGVGYVALARRGRQRAAG